MQSQDVAAGGYTSRHDVDRELGRRLHSSWCSIDLGRLLKFRHDPQHWRVRKCAVGPRQFAATAMSAQHPGVISTLARDRHLIS